MPVSRPFLRVFAILFRSVLYFIIIFFALCYISALSHKHHHHPHSHTSLFNYQNYHTNTTPRHYHPHSRNSRNGILLFQAAYRRKRLVPRKHHNPCVRLDQQSTISGRNVVSVDSERAPSASPERRRQST